MRQITPLSVLANEERSEWMRALIRMEYSYPKMQNVIPPASALIKIVTEARYMSSSKYISLSTISS